MWKISRVFIVFIATIWLGVSSSSVVEKKAETMPYVEGEVLVKIKDSIHSSNLKSLHATMGSRVLHATKLRDGELQLIRLPQGMKVEDAIKLYNQSPYVEYAEPNYIVRKAQLIPNDPYFNLQWGLRNVGQNVDGFVGTQGIDIEIVNLWAQCQGGDVVVAVLDTGVDYNHPDLTQNIWSNPGEVCNNGVDDDGNGYVDDCVGWNFAYNTNNPMDDDVDGHGTHVAGIIGAVGNNNQFLAGVNWSVKIMPVKFMDNTGAGTIDAVVRAIRYAVNNGAKIINASYAYPFDCYATTPSKAEREALNYAKEKGVLVVAAAGNSGCNNDIYPTYPASYRMENVISVTAINSKGEMPYWANYGSLSVHLAAPGFRIYSLLPNGRYGQLSGTSMATPFVSGVASLLYACRSEMDYLKVRELLLSTVKPLTSTKDKTLSGGMLNAYGALSSQPVPLKPKIVSLEIGEGQIRLIFRDLSYIEDGFYVRLAPLGQNLQTVSELGSSQGAYNLITYTRNYNQDEEAKEYIYSVCAYNQYGESCIESQSFFIPLKSPTELSYSLSGNVVKLTWVDNSRVEDGYMVERKKEGEQWRVIATLPQNANSYIDTLQSSGVYSYRVRAYKGSVYSDYSQEVYVSYTSQTASNSSKGGGCSTGGLVSFAYSAFLLGMLILLRRLKKSF